MSVGLLRPLHHRQFAAMWAASALSAVGVWMQIAALGIYTAETTGQAAWVGAVLAGSWLTLGLVSPWAGILADRYDRRWLIALASLGQALLAGVLSVAFLRNAESPALITAVVLLEGALVAIARPAYVALLADLVPAEDLPQANALGTVSWDTMRLIGPALAVLLLTLSSYHVIFLVNCLTFLAPVAAVLTVSAPKRLAIAPSGSWHFMRQGLAAVRRRPELRSPMLLGIATMGLGGPYVALVPAFAQLTLRAGPSGTARLLMAQAVGGVLAGFVLSWGADRLGTERLLRILAVGMALSGIGFAASPTLWWAVVFAVALGACFTGIYVGCSTLLQRDALPEMRGRVISLFFAFTSVAYALASLTLGAVADVVGIRPVLMIGFAALLLVAWTLLRRNKQVPAARRTADADRSPEREPAQIRA